MDELRSVAALRVQAVVGPAVDSQIGLFVRSSAAPRFDVIDGQGGAFGAARAVGADVFAALLGALQQAIADCDGDVA